jgi:hypothetical protein
VNAAAGVRAGGPVRSTNESSRVTHPHVTLT